MSYPYGAPGGYPQQGQGGYPQQGGYPGMPQPGGGGAGGFVQPGMPQPGGGMPQPGIGMPQPGGGMPQPGGGMPQPGGGYPQQYPQQGYPQQPQMGMPTADSASGAYGAGAPGGLPYSMNPPATGGYGGAGGPPAPGYGQMYGQPGGGAPPAGGYAPQQPQQPGYPGGQPQTAAYSTPQPTAAPYNPQAQQHQQQQQPMGQQTSGSYSSSGSSGGAATGYKQRADPTVKPMPGFNAEGDSKALRKAMKGFGTDEKAIIDVLGYRSNGQRQQIKTTYKTMFGRDLIADLKSELSGKFEDVIIAVMMKPEEFDAYELKRAMRGAGTDEDALIEILCTRNNNQIREIVQTYKVLYGKNLEKEIQSETSGHFRKFLVSMLAGGRNENQQVSVNEAAQDAQNLLQAGVKRMGTDESVFNSVFALRNHEQLRAVIEAYAKCSGHDIRVWPMWSLKTCGLSKLWSLKTVFTVVLTDNLLQAGVKRMGTDESVFNSVFALRSHEQLRAVIEAYTKCSGHDIVKDIKGEFSGNLESGLITIVDCVRSKTAYFAKRLYHSMKGLGTDDRTLIRVVVSRSEVDMVQVKQEFQKNYGKTLESFIQDDVSGDYRRFLLALVTGN